MDVTTIKFGRNRAEIHKDCGEWRWRLIASNGSIMAHGGKSYESRANAQRALESVQRVLCTTYLSS